MDANATPTHQKILVLGRGGSGKSSQIWTLPGRKFAYLFDPGSLASLAGLDLDYELFLPDASELDMGLRGFNKDSKSDIPKKIPGAKSPEPLTYLQWSSDFNVKVSSNFFADYDWLCFDSLTLLSKAMMDRQLWLNNRFGDLEDRADYRVTGSKMGTVFRSICSLPINIYATGHFSTFENEKTKQISTELNLPGSARTMLPLLFSNIWELRATSDDKARYIMVTKPEMRGFQEIRTSLLGLKPVEDMVIGDFNKPTNYGVGRLLSIAKSRGNVIEARNRTVALAEEAARAQKPATEPTGTQSIAA